MFFTDSLHLAHSLFFECLILRPETALQDSENTQLQLHQALLRKIILFKNQIWFFWLDTQKPMDTFGFKLHISQMQICIMGIIILTLHGFYTVVLPFFFCFFLESFMPKFLSLWKMQTRKIQLCNCPDNNRIYRHARNLKSVAQTCNLIWRSNY